MKPGGSIANHSRMSPHLLLCLIGTAVSLSPQDFKHFHQTSYRPQGIPSRPQFPFYEGFGDFRQPTRHSFYNPKPSSGNKGIIHAFSRPQRRPFRPINSHDVFKPQGPRPSSVSQGENFSLVKLRKLYSRLTKGQRPGQGQGQPHWQGPAYSHGPGHWQEQDHGPGHRYTTPSPVRRYTIPPDYIRYDFNRPLGNYGVPSRNYRTPEDHRIQQDEYKALQDDDVPQKENETHDYSTPKRGHGLLTPHRSTNRKSRGKEDNKLVGYLGPNNTSVIFETRLQAAVGVHNDLPSVSNRFGAITPYHEPSNYVDEGGEFINRSKRYSVRNKHYHNSYSSYPMGHCSTTEGDEGHCFTAPRCHMMGGTPKFSDSCSFGVCCIMMISTCGSTVWTNDTIWTSPQDNDTVGDVCTLKVLKMSNNICQIRLDLRELQIKLPSDGSCLEDRFLVEGQNINSIIPHLCGNATGDHIYIDVNNSTGPVELKFINVGNNFTRKWRIQISQIECNNPNRPPQNCLQYLTQTVGTFGIFNWRSSTSQYLNNLNYAICFKKGVGYCSIQYEVAPMSQFNFINEEAGIATVTTGNAGVGSIDCPDDYIVIAANRLCGDRFNDGSLPSMSENAKVTDSTNGPLIVQVRSNESKVGKGFQLNYQQLPC